MVDLEMLLKIITRLLGLSPLPICSLSFVPIECLMGYIKARPAILQKYRYKFLVLKVFHEYARFITVDIFEINILVAIKSFYIRTYTNKLFSFVCCSLSLLLFLCVFEETIQCSPFVPNFFTAQ